jgi:pimeloyl-ACP methyl ester carboxylesterase
MTVEITEEATSRRLVTEAGITLSYDVFGRGPPLVLVHGAFDDHRTNWARVKPLLAERFTVYPVARRGRGETDTTEGHNVEDEAADIAALIKAIDEPVFLLGHSYGAQVALAAAARLPHRVRKLVLYEPPWPHTVSRDGQARLEALAKDGDWDGFATTFFHGELKVPVEVLDELRASGDWSAIVGDAKASLGDLRAMCGYAFNADRFCDLDLPVLLQIGTESPRDIFATDALAATLPEVHIDELEGQAHECMQTAPELYAQSVTRFLMS